jgi:hypothetical protein
MGKILDAIRKEQAQEDRHAVKKIVEADAGDDKLLGSGSGFAAACAQSAAEKAKKMEAQAIRDIRDGQTEAEVSRKAFHRKYVPVLGRSRVDELILNYR